VYRLMPERSVIAVKVEVVSVGRRESLAAYVEAAKRLGRLRGDT
jgi:hypothetical protein